MEETLKAGVVYFALVFGAGFVLGTIRTLWVAPRVGVRTAELAEAPMMFGISILAACDVGTIPWWPPGPLFISCRRSAASRNPVH
jgi:hypothetical protein